MIVRSYDGKEPRFGARVFVADNAAIVGDVELGDDCSIWFGTTVRADIHSVRIGARTNVQDNCTIHVSFPHAPVVIGDEVTIGHGAIVHGCTVGHGALIGMGARVLDGAEVGAGALIGAGAVVREGMRVPPGVLVLGIPGRVVRELTDAERERVAYGWKNYVEVKEKYLRQSV